MPGNTKTCANCGALMGSTMRMCPHCGARMAATTTPTQGSASAPTQAPQPSMMPAYSGFWRRVGAFLIDLAIVSPFALLLSQFIPVASTIIALWIYFAAQESSSFQGTFGKRALGIKVTDVNGVRLKFGRASTRLFSKFLSGAILGIGFLMPMWTRHSQALHDIISGTLVYRRN